MSQTVIKLSPPQINASLPAFIAGEALTIPFSLNRAVGRNDFNEIALIVRTVQTNIQKVATSTGIILQNENKEGLVVYDYKERIWKAQFSHALLTSQGFTPQAGQYYKVQIACIDKNGIVGYYSTVGVIKCISKPRVYIKDRENTVNNTYDYVGVYSQEGNDDQTEKVYSYCFNLYDENNKLIATSGTQLHNSANDKELYESTDSWTIRKNLEPNLHYQIGYSVTTMNGYVSNEVRYTIIDAETVDPTVHASLTATPIFEDGYIKISLVGDNSGIYVNGSFVLLRASSEDNYDSWNELTRFQLVNWDSNSIKDLCKDYVIQQGCHYKYAIQAYNLKGLYSNKMLNKEGPVLCDFEDAFLYDGERQLKIRFNPKVSSFKSTVLESKTDTIGGKYPFIFRNGNVEYKEFQISGLLSIMGDENNEFLTGLPYNNQDLRNITAAKDVNVYDMGTWLTAENYRRERNFKMEVLTWLTNGKPKLFRSPAEGNYIVRLMNTSLTPNDSLGRMLHTFQSTAYEIATYNYKNLQDYGFTVAPYVEARTMKVNQINLNNVPQSMIDSNNNVIIPGAYFATIVADPDKEFTYELSDGATNWGNTNLTGTFVFPEEVLKATPLVALKLNSPNWGRAAYLTYGYYDTSTDNFSLIESIDIKDEVNQFLGEGLNPDRIDEGYPNIITALTDLRIKLGAFHYLKVAPRLTSRIYFLNGNYYSATNGLKMETGSWNPVTIYEVVDYETLSQKIGYIDGRYPPEHKNHQILAELSYWFGLKDSKKNSLIGETDLNGREAMFTRGKFDALTGLSSVGEIYLGNALYIDAVYQIKTITYSIESEDSSIITAKNHWLTAKNKYEALTLSSNNQEVISAAKADMNTKYNTYIKTLSNALDKQEGENIDYAI